MRSQSGFTLIELIIVVVILGILSVVAAPRFLDLQDDAGEAAFEATAAAFKEGVNQVHLAWLVRGNGVAVLDFLPIGNPEVGGALSVNSAGYPADTRGSSTTLNSLDDCLDVWRAVLADGSVGVGTAEDADYSAVYNNPGSCTYTLKANPDLSIAYNSNSGNITVNR